MAIQHVDIQEGNLHEPKGVSLATANTVYVANGGGTGTWKPVDTSSLSGLGTQGGVSDLQVVSDGTGGFKYVPSTAYGSITITNNTNAFTVTAATDATLNTISDYATFTGTGAPWADGLFFGAGSQGDGINIITSGVYRIDTWLDVTSYPSNVAKLAIRYLVNSGGYSERKITTKSNSAADAGNLSGFGLVALTSGDIVRLAIASTVSGGVIISSGNLTLTLVRAT